MFSWTNHDYWQSPHVNRTLQEASRKGYEENAAEQEFLRDRVRRLDYVQSGDRPDAVIRDP